MPDINRFKQQLADGGARPNQFKVNITFPTGGEWVGDKQLLVTGAALPASTVNPVITQYRGREIKFAGERIFDPWTITIVNDNKMSLREGFEKWMELMNEKESNEGKIAWDEYSKRIVIQHLDRNNDPTNTITLIDAFPINMSEIALAYAQNDIIEEYTVTFQYQTYESNLG